MDEKFQCERKFGLELEDIGDDDHHTITFDLPDSKSFPSPLLRGMSLDLSFAEAREAKDDESHIQETDILVRNVIEFPT